MSEIYYYRPYDKTAYTEYLQAICKHVGTTYILNEYLKLDRYVKEKNLKLSANMKRIDNRFYIYLYYETPDIRILYEMLRDTIDALKKDFPWVTENAAFVDSKRKNMFVVIHYYVGEKSKGDKYKNERL
ncbi:MAG: hypothetical protein PUG54_04265 [Firmicutes bacterium]|nr:hypothetical protein [Bacillota bacterium]